MIGIVLALVLSQTAASSSTENPSTSGRDFATQGTVDLGGSASLAVTSIAGASSFSLALSPGVGFFPVNGLRIGFGLTAGLSTSEAGVSGAFGLDVSLGYYFRTKTILYPYLSASGGFVAAKSSTGPLVFAPLFGFGPGLAVQVGKGGLFFVEPNLNLVPYIGALLIQFSIGAGFRVYF